MRKDAYHDLEKGLKRRKEYNSTIFFHFIRSNNVVRTLKQVVKVVSTSTLGHKVQNKARK